jgi:hypothetical protein
MRSIDDSLPEIAAADNSKIYGNFLGRKHA